MILDFKNYFDIIYQKLNLNTMNKEELKNKIVEANKKYRSGNPIMSDIEYDNLLEDYQKMVSNDEYTSFRNTLNEGMIEYGKKIKHKYILGSLDKIKNSDVKALNNFIHTQIKNKINVSAKVDGISSEIVYENGKIISASTRGNGCLSEESIIEFEDGRKIPIGVVCKLNINGNVKTFNEKTNKVEYKPIIFHSIKRNTNNWIEISLENGNILKVTEDHLIYTTNRGWIKAIELTTKDDLLISK